MSEFRLATPAELPLVAALNRDAYAEYLPVLGMPPVPMDEDYAPRIAAGEVWLLDEDGDIPALAVLESHPDHLTVFSFAVRPGCQGRGLGQRLLAFADQRARAEGVDEVRLYTNAKMERNIGIYLRAGYVETHRAPNPKRPEFTVVYMAKSLR